jgi:hypothetical protein
MAADDKKTKTTPAPKAEAPAPKAEAPAKKPKEPAAKTESVAPADASKAEAGEATAAPDRPKSYSRGEGQKAVTQAYKDNWNAIFGKKKKR